MLFAYDARSHRLDPAPALPERGWIHAREPTAEDEAQLRAAGVPEDFLVHARDLDELPRFEHDAGGARLVVIRVPLRGNGGGELPYRTTSLAVIFAGERVITVAPGRSDSIDAMLEIRGLEPERPNRFLLQIVWCTASRFLHHLRDLDADVDKLEDSLKASLGNQEVLGLLRLQKGLVHFTTALQLDRILLERLEEDLSLRNAGDDRDLLEDAEVELRQALETSRISSDILGNMMDAFASIISNNLNVVMKVMTALMIILAVPATVAAFYGMNVDLPFQHHPAAFAAIIVTSVALAGLIARFFVVHDWL